jgi:hypothetical protein
MQLNADISIDLQNADIILVANAEQIIDLQNAIKCRYKY